MERAKATSSRWAVCAIALIDKTDALRQQATNTRANISRMQGEIQQIRDDLAAVRTRDSDATETLGKRLLETQKERRESELKVQGLLAQTDAFESQARAEIKRRARTNPSYRPNNRSSSTQIARAHSVPPQSRAGSSGPT